MNKATKPQISKIYVLLNQLGLIEQKEDLVFQFSNHRATSTRELTYQQAKELIQHLSKYDPLDKMRKKVFALAYEAGIIYGDTWEDRKMNAAKLNSFILDRGTVKKELAKMSKEELIKTVNQFEELVKHQHSAQASKMTKSLLQELNIQTQTPRKSK